MFENIAMKRIKFFNKKQREYNEYKLIEQAQSGCDESFEKIINIYKEYLYKTAFLYTKNEHDALDIYQETVYKAYINISKLRNPNFFKTWITKVLINNVNMKNRHYSKFQDEEVEDYIGEISYSSIEENIDLYDAIDSLDEKYKTPIILQYFQDLTVTQISDIMECNENTVKSYIRRGKKKLYDILKEGNNE
ncbi:sigma-70 family RNA polymerase sigma factor [Romboutsia sp. 1001216sp1]|uniref:sigma-70 family RNA polymerase sigma factor n=1 Tax=Romboutsia TaxID=1501226 RepID=UPI000A5F52E7|nr:MULTISPECIES: sigma-70 family RNA polymerase sigma factor [Romboutsia]MDB8794179.1 sigma-70 family RNA polymerase sigma factor [Romboutsia sp. 1001216sp1]MDB8797208.1 sigma-70 family RNA polymerase sigma factor [Romboutsia sp. 1001216sp1]MDB8800006.1 sigma-70 family RNA polymerase sigma factor [Romboutsia sp. 1001216sp1]